MKRGRAHQSTLESCKGVVVLPSGSSALVFSSSELARLKALCDDESTSEEQLKDTLRILSSFVISTLDLETSMVGRSVNKLRHSPLPGVASMADRLVSKWREEVERAKAAKAPPPPSKQRDAAVLAAIAASLERALRDPSGASTATAMALSQALAACCLEFAAGAPRAAALAKLEAGIQANSTLRVALLSGWLTPAEAVRSSPDALLRADFMA